MAENLLISHGEPQWDTKYNKLVTAVQNLGGVVDNLNWTDFTDNGIVYQNGFQPRGGIGANRTGYRYLQVGNVKLVELQVNLKLTVDPGEGVMNLTALSVPASVVPGATGVVMVNSDKYSVTFDDGALSISKANGDISWWTGDGSYYQLHTLYTSNN
jgi:hypothetical protein